MVNIRVRANNREILVQDFEKLSESLGIKTSLDNIVPDVRQWSKDEAGPDWMMVFDNADVADLEVEDL